MTVPCDMPWLSAPKTFLLLTIALRLDKLLVVCIGLATTILIIKVVRPASCANSKEPHLSSSRSRRIRRDGLGNTFTISDAQAHPFTRPTELFEHLMTHIISGKEGFCR